jgi:ABC-type branched-subunit amino acid transport system ATPase component
VSSEGLVVERLGVRFGGHWAVQGLDLAAPQGTVTGLIGPNGAGKTTTFNACNGLLHPTEGAIRFAGTDVTTRSVPARARLGLGRTFQQLQLYSSMTVRENVALGAEASRIGGNPLRQIFSVRGDRQRVRDAADAAVALCGLDRVADERVDTLSTGWQRLTELARACAGDYRLILLDEPSAGLDQGETEEFARIVRRLVNEREVGILLVEHDMSLVMTVCAHIFVLDFGVLIFEGSPHEVQASPAVRSAYLGSVEGLEGAGVKHAEPALRQ